MCSGKPPTTATRKASLTRRNRARLLAGRGRDGAGRGVGQRELPGAVREARSVEEGQHPNQPWLAPAISPSTLGPAGGAKASTCPAVAPGLPPHQAFQGRRGVVLQDVRVHCTAGRRQMSRQCAKCSRNEGGVCGRRDVWLQHTFLAGGWAGRRAGGRAGGRAGRRAASSSDVCSHTTDLCLQTVRSCTGPPPAGLPVTASARRWQCCACAWVRAGAPGAPAAAGWQPGSVAASAQHGAAPAHRIPGLHAIVPPSHRQDRGPINQRVSSPLGEGSCGSWQPPAAQLRVPQAGSSTGPRLGPACQAGARARGACRHHGGWLRR